MQNVVRLYEELYDAMKGPRRQARKRGSNQASRLPAPPPTPPADEEDVLEPEEDHASRSEHDEKRARYGVVIFLVLPNF